MFDKSLQALAFGLVAALTLSAATPSFAQSRHHQPAASRAEPDDTPHGALGEAPGATSHARTGASQQHCWVSTDPFDRDYGYFGDCSARGARPTK